MRRKTRNPPPNQRSLDFFFGKTAETKESPSPDSAVLPKEEDSKGLQTEIDNNIKPIVSLQPTYSPIISLSDFEMEFSSQGQAKASSGNEFTDSEEYEKNESQASSPRPDACHPSISTRHSSQVNNVPEKNIVLTPNWIATDYNHYDQNNFDESFVSFDQNSIQDVHYQLEVLERRIQYGDDEVHEHPAMAVQVLYESGVGVLTDEEKELKEGYKTVKCNKIKPCFWEPRCYDDEYMQLSRTDNKLLKDAIQKIDKCTTKHFNNKIATWHPIDELIPSEQDRSCVLRLPSPKKKEVKNRVTNNKNEISDLCQQKNVNRMSNSPKPKRRIFFRYNIKLSNLPRILFGFLPPPDFETIEEKEKSVLDKPIFDGSELNQINELIPPYKFQKPSNFSMERHRQLQHQQYLIHQKQLLEKLKKKKKQNKKININENKNIQKECNRSDPIRCKSPLKQFLQRDEISLRDLPTTANSKFVISDGEYDNDEPANTTNNNNNDEKAVSVSNDTPKKEALKLRLPAFLFDTDDSDEETDFEDF